MAFNLDKPTSKTPRQRPSKTIRLIEPNIPQLPIPTSDLFSKVEKSRIPLENITDTLAELDRINTLQDEKIDLERIKNLNSTNSGLLQQELIIATSDLLGESLSPEKLAERQEKIKDTMKLKYELKYKDDPRGLAIWKATFEEIIAARLYNEVKKQRNARIIAESKQIAHEDRENIKVKIEAADTGTYTAVFYQALLEEFKGIILRLNTLGPAELKLKDEIDKFNKDYISTFLKKLHQRDKTKDNDPLSDAYIERGGDVDYSLIDDILHERGEFSQDKEGKSHLDTIFEVQGVKRTKDLVEKLKKEVKVAKENQLKNDKFEVVKHNDDLTETFTDKIISFYEKTLKGTPEKKLEAKREFEGLGSQILQQEFKGVEKIRSLKSLNDFYEQVKKHGFYDQSNGELVAKIWDGIWLGKIKSILDTVPVTVRGTVKVSKMIMEDGVSKVIYVDEEREMTKNVTILSLVSKKVKDKNGEWIIEGISVKELDRIKGALGDTTLVQAYKREAEKLKEFTTPYKALVEGPFPTSFSPIRVRQFEIAVRNAYYDLKKQTSKATGKPVSDKEILEDRTSEYYIEKHSLVRDYLNPVKINAANFEDLQRLYGEQIGTDIEKTDKNIDPTTGMPIKKTISYITLPSGRTITEQNLLDAQKALLDNPNTYESFILNFGKDNLPNEWK